MSKLYFLSSYFQQINNSEFIVIIAFSVRFLSIYNKSLLPRTCSECVIVCLETNEIDFIFTLSRRYVEVSWQWTSSRSPVWNKWVRKWLNSSLRPDSLSRDFHISRKTVRLNSWIWKLMQRKSKGNFHFYKEFNETGN
jgi:hypothetical protein